MYRKPELWQLPFEKMKEITKVEYLSKSNITGQK